MAQEQASWLPQSIDFALIHRDSGSTCGGKSDLSSCGSSFPSDFCCPQSTTCVQLNTTSQISATLCCPVGGDCSTIAPISCDLGSQNASLVPYSQYHSYPLATLATCGDNCCPLGYACQNAACVMVKNPMEANATSAASSATSTPTQPVSSIVPLPTSSQTSSLHNATSTAVPDAEPTKAASSAPFSGSSFAAGFVPGVLIGAVLAACVLFLLFRKRHRNSMLESHNEKARQNQQRDTLTDLGSHPTVFGQTISNPTPVRTNFGPPRTPPNQKSPESDASASESESAPRLELNQAFLNIPTQEPHPWHVKRGTISPNPLSTSATAGHKYTPPHMLRQKQSAGNLRNQASNSNTRGGPPAEQPQQQSLRPGLDDRTGSSETIAVHLHHTPDQRLNQQQQQQQRRDDGDDDVQASSRDTWTSHSAQHDDTSNDAHDDEDDLSPIIQRGPRRRPTDISVPPPQQARHDPTAAALGTPYTPSIYPPSLALPARRFLRTDPVELRHGREGAPGSNRDTTWSGVINNFVASRR